MHTCINKHKGNRLLNYQLFLKLINPWFLCTASSPNVFVYGHKLSLFLFLAQSWLQIQIPKKQLNYVAAPKHWMLNKLPEMLLLISPLIPRYLPQIILLRNGLMYALTGDEEKKRSVCSTLERLTGK